MLDRVDRLLDWWSRALVALAIIAAAAMMIHVSVDVFSRSVLNAPLRQTNQMVAAYYMIAVAFLPIALLGRRDEHISVDVFTNLMPAWLRRIFSIFATLLGMAYMYVFTWQSWISAGRRTGQGEVLEISGGFLIVWPARWFLPIAGASLFLVFTLRLIRQILSKDGDLDQATRPHDI